MSALAFALAACPKLQFQLNDAFGNKTVTEEFPFFEFIGSALNRSGLTQQVSPGKGKVKTVELTYTPRLDESVVKSNQPNPTCSATDKVGDLTATYTIDTDENFQVSEQIDSADFEQNCKDVPTYFAERVQALLDVMDRRLATEHTNDAAALSGKWAKNVTVNGSDELVIDLSLANGNYDPMAMQKIKRAAQKTAFTNGQIIFADDLLVDYYDALKAGCCSQQGIDLSAILAQHGIAVSYDRRVADAFGAGSGIIVAPQALVLLNYTRNEWKQGLQQQVRTEGNEFWMTVVSPRTGVPLDLMVKYDCGKIHIILTATTKLVGMPDDMFNTGDLYEGVKWVNKILAQA